MPLHPDKPRCAARAKIKVKDADGNPLRDDDGKFIYERDDDGECITRPCPQLPRAGATVCHTHGGSAPQVKSRALVRRELDSWGLGDFTVDPGVILLRLVSQSAARAELYATLLAEAYDAAERLKEAHDATDLVETPEGEDETAATQTARADLDRIFTTGGVAALIGNTYSASNAGSVYATGEAIRGLAKLEADERDRCAGFAAKAVAAGLAERVVRLAEKEAAMVIAAVDAALDAAGIPVSERGPAKRAAARHLQAV